MKFVFHVDRPDQADSGTESAIQTRFQSKMRNIAPHVMLVGIPNAGRRTAWESRQRGKEGMVAGFPDMMVLHDGKAFGLEFKTKTGSLSDKQIDVLNKLVKRRIPVGVFRSADSAVNWLRGHGVIS